LAFIQTFATALAVVLAAKGPRGGARIGSQTSRTTELFCFDIQIHHIFVPKGTLSL